MYLLNIRFLNIFLNIFQFAKLMQYIFRFPANTERQEKWLYTIVIHLSYPEYVLAIHSSKGLLVEQISPPTLS